MNIFKKKSLKDKYDSLNKEIQNSVFREVEKYQKNNNCNQKCLNIILNSHRTYNISVNKGELTIKFEKIGKILFWALPIEDKIRVYLEITKN
jgi:hypothetical protein